MPYNVLNNYLAQANIPAPDAGRYFIANPVFRKQDGGHYITIDGKDLPVTVGGQVLKEFIAGWRPVGLFLGFAPMLLLEFEHEDGRQATWFMDYRLEHLTDKVGGLTSELRGQLRHLATPIVREIVTQFTNQCDILWGGQAAAFLKVNMETRRQIAQLCLDQVMLPPIAAHGPETLPSTMLYWGDDGGLRAINKAALFAGLEETWQERLPGFIEKGAVIWPSPADGTPVAAQGSLVFDDFHFAYRFADHRNRLVFYVLIARHDSLIAGLWIPAVGLIFPARRTGGGVAREVLTIFAQMFVTHTVCWALPLEAYLKKRANRFASVMRGRPGLHIGHQVWNELSGIDLYVRDHQNILPEWLILNAEGGIEVYGRTEELFPELEGKVNRSLKNRQELIRWAYESGTFIMRLTTEFVSKSLRDRIQGRVATLPVAREVRNIQDGMPSAPVILIGLRVENRTIVDLTGFMIRFIGEVMRRFGTAIIVFDGHNSRNEEGGLIESHGEGGDGIPPIEVERQLVRDARAAFAGLPVEIYDTIGMPLSASLAWGAASDCFVSFWGAGLAKYRWVCNKPGYILTSHWNLLRRLDLHIYDDNRFMEEPGPVTFVDAALVRDDGQAKQLISFGNQESYFNFHVDEAALFPRMLTFIEDRLRDRTGLAVVAA